MHKKHVQGVVSQLFFNITNGISNNIRLFADDTSLFVIIDDDVIQQTSSITFDIDTIKNWSNTWAVDFSAKKL